MTVSDRSRKRTIGLPDALFGFITRKNISLYLKIDLDIIPQTDFYRRPLCSVFEVCKGVPFLIF